MSRTPQIPKSAIKPLAEYCAQRGNSTGRPPATIFKEYLTLIKQYAGNFDEPWPATQETRLGFTDKETAFINAAPTLPDRLARFILVCLRRNISLQGFDAAGYEHDFAVYGGRRCNHCLVPRAERLRQFVAEMEQARRNVEEDLQRTEPSWLSKEMADHYQQPDVVKADQMTVAELRMLEALGAVDKHCSVKNEFQCPYGDQYRDLMAEGMFAERLWTHIRWYDRHHKDAEPLVDVTRFDDLWAALDDGRLDQVIREHKAWMKETGAAEWQI